MLKRTVKSCGPDASMVGVKSAEGKSARPGADEPAIRRRRRQTSPILRGERDISCKAIAQGMSDCLRCPVCSCALSFAQFAHETAGAACIRHSLLPLLFWRDNETQASGKARAARTRTRIRCLNRIKTPTASLRGALATKQSISPSKERMDCFAALAMTTLDDVPHHPSHPCVSSSPHPEERALARVSKDEGGRTLRDAAKRPLLRVRTYVCPIILRSRA